MMTRRKSRAAVEPPQGDTGLPDGAWRGQSSRYFAAPGPLPSAPGRTGEQGKVPPGEDAPCCPVGADGQG